MNVKVISGRPQSGEFADYAADDIAFVAGDDAVEALAQSAARITAYFESLDERAIAGYRYAPGKWTLKEILGHLIDDERIFLYRALCIARNDTRPLPGFDENDYVAATDFDSRPLAGLLTEYRVTRESTLAFYRSLSEEEWQRSGTANGYTASVRGLAFHMAGHELHHLRVMLEKYQRQA
jgi:hypothetical protein